MIRRLFILVLGAVIIGTCGPAPKPRPEREVIPPLTPIAEGEAQLNGYRIVTGASATLGELWTNIDAGGQPHPNIIRIPTDTPIYDISYVVYSKASPSAMASRTATWRCSTRGCT